jgi:predicted nucleotidyltransferase component of viral defense system
MTGFPDDFSEVEAWASANGVSVAEARRRYAQRAILVGLSTQPILRNALVFKGGNALDFVVQPNRGTIDLDFTIDTAGSSTLQGTEALSALFSDALVEAARRYDLALQVNSVKQRPPGADKTRFSYDVRVGYGLPDESSQRQRMARGLKSTQVIPIEISSNDVICSYDYAPIDAGFPRVKIATIEDIIAEKLRALLQQPIRNRERRQDVLDIAVLIRLHPDIDRPRVGGFLVLKCEARDINPRKSSFLDPEVRRRAAIDYDALESTTRVLFIPFDEAWEMLIAFVSTLPIPD